jgi:hypothetical protein
MERGLAAILAAEVVGNSRLMELDELGTLDAFKALREKLIDLVLTSGIVCHRVSVKTPAETDRQRRDCIILRA